MNRDQWMRLFAGEYGVVLGAGLLLAAGLPAVNVGYVIVFALVSLIVIVQLIP